jgi:hypothetical protein
MTTFLVFPQTVKPDLSPTRSGTAEAVPYKPLRYETVLQTSQNELHKNKLQRAATNFNELH